MFHVGGGRTALYNWLYARKHNGQFVLRIEDTDESRNEDQWTDLIFESMKWLGLNWDELHTQSENAQKHADAGRKLFANGNAYYCGCTQDEVRARTADNAKPGYDNHCRNLGLEPGDGRALRFRVPEGQTHVTDLIRGNPVFDNSNIEDFVIVRSTGVPVYLLANVVDDMDQRISHVVRAEEHLNNTPKQMMLWKALGGGDVPVYAHLPLIVNEKRQKISKRRDKVSMQMFRDEGFLPEAMCNYLALLGWSPSDDREIIDLDTMCQEFDFSDVNKAGAFFDLKKLTHINGEYIRKLSNDEFVTRAMPFLERAKGKQFDAALFDEQTFRRMAPLVQERVERLDEVAEMVFFFFVDLPDIDEAALLATKPEQAIPVLESVARGLANCDWNHAALHESVAHTGEGLGLALRKAQAPVRLAVTGRKVGPPLFESMEVLGRDAVLKRIERLVGILHHAS